ncbi:hypothetical protein AAHA92_01007 [Salvia divinorum]|uniref:Uncharacterized protein n=1 Tax=Salvia divinorum TaxID=28513 RepID=A0ABD1ILG1_SALDI
MDKLEKAILSALEKTKQPAPTEKCQAPLGQEEAFPYYGPPRRWSTQLKFMPLGVGKPTGAGTRESKETLPGETILTLGGPMQIRISQPCRPKIFRTVWRDQLVGQVEIPKVQTNEVIEIKEEILTGPAAINPTGPVEISREILSIHMYLHIRRDFRAAEQTSKHKEARDQTTVITKAMEQTGVSTPSKGRGTTTQISKGTPISTNGLAIISMHLDQASHILSSSRSRWTIWLETCSTCSSISTATCMPTMMLCISCRMLIRNKGLQWIC